MTSLSCTNKVLSESSGGDGKPICSPDTRRPTETRPRCCRPGPAASMHVLVSRSLHLVAVVGLALGLVATAAGCGTGASSNGSTAGSDGSAAGSDVSAAGSDTASDGASSDGESNEPSPDDLYPDVVDVVAEQSADGTWEFDVTLSSPYDSPQRYADAWRVLDPDGVELGVRELAHDHANEQPFTRSLSGVVIPDDVTEVTVEGRDQRNGWGGATKTIPLVG